MSYLETFIKDKMSMSHIYQPVMIKTILEHGGKADKRNIAKTILSYDFSQIEYYEGINFKIFGN